MLEAVKHKIKAVPDITLHELIEQLNLPVKKSALCNAILHKLKLTRKKDDSRFRAGASRCRKETRRQNL